MRADRVLRDIEPGRDLVGAEVLVQQEQDLELPRTERRGDLVGHATIDAAFPHLLEQAPGDLAGKGGLALGDSTQELGDPLGRLALQQVAGSAAADRGQEVRLGAGSGEHDDLGLRGGLTELRQRLQPLHPRHREVEQDEFRPVPAGELDRLRAVGRLTHDLEAVLGEQRAERVARDRVVVD
jgi:hypothetical protein